MDKKEVYQNAKYYRNCLETKNANIALRVYEKEQRVELFDVELKKSVAEGVLIFSVPDSMGHLLIIYKLLEKPLFKYTVYRIENSYDIIAESWFRYPDCETATKNGLLIFHVIEKYEKRFTSKGTIKIIKETEPLEFSESVIKNIS